MMYPYLELLQYYPRDYYWMYAAIFQICVFLIFMAANHLNSVNEKRIYSFISLMFAIISATVLLGNYFVQFAVVPISMLQGQTEGIPLLSQYNGNGVFIALEELGFTMMAIAFFFLALALSNQSRMEMVLRWVLAAPLVINIIAFTAYSIQYGLFRDYRYEVIAISVGWLACIFAGFLLSLKYHREIKVNKT